MKEATLQLVDRILSYIDRYPPGEASADMTEEAFGELALQLFEHQFRSNPAVKKYAQARRRTPLTIRTWRDIPPMPIQAFKELTLSCEPIEEAEAVFMTSGTTNADKRGRHYHPTLRVWDASMASPFKRFVLPDTDRMRMLVLSPGAELNAHSSLSRYLTRAVELYGAAGSRNYFRADNGLEMSAVLSDLRAVAESGEPVLLLGATFAYVHLLDFAAEQGFTVKLPAGSRILDTGGLKGQAREISAEELYSQFHAVFGVERSACVNMYGMTELSSQLYDQSIGHSAVSFMDNAADNSIDNAANSSAAALQAKVSPPWLRTLVLHPDTLEPVADGQTGVLAHYDLCSFNSAVAILTEDIGYKSDSGLVLLGRLKGSEARGCSIALDQLLRAARNG
ncbi:CoF synthetase [Paenibacillus sp. YYML68]|uniref:LuxE/PaaK family acyltransferase n=1 Tax=Paenibacillus sp. YYML68 TaxID=2909250 RepID=UPI0024926F0F|nr:CoF synthetase [Paenibacillus sp. YYML68]